MKHRSKIGRIAIGLLCLILLVFVTAELAHGHAGEAGSSHCQLCAAAHLAPDVQPAFAAAIALQCLGIVRLGEPSPGARAVLVTAFIRPPPASF